MPYSCENCFSCEYLTFKCHQSVEEIWQENRERTERCNFSKKCCDKPFPNFSWRFLNPTVFFQLESQLFLCTIDLRRKKLKKTFCSKIVDFFCFLKNYTCKLQRSCSNKASEKNVQTNMFTLRAFLIGAILSVSVSLQYTV